MIARRAFWGVLAMPFADLLVGDLAVVEERVTHFAHRLGYTMEYSSQDEVRMTLEAPVQEIDPTGQVSPRGARGEVDSANRHSNARSTSTSSEGHTNA